MSAEKRLFVSARSPSAAAAATNARRSADVAIGIAPEPRTTTPFAGWLATNARRRAPNAMPSGGPPVTVTSVAPAARKPRRWRSAVVARASATQRSSSPARGPGSGCRMSTATSDIQPSLPIRRQALTRRVRAYVGLGANVGDPAETIAAGIQSLAALPGARLRRRLAALRDRAGRRRRPAGVPQRGCRDRRPARPRSRHRRAGAARRAEAAGASIRTAGARALGAARAGPRPARLRPPPNRRRATGGGPIDGSISTDGPRRSASARRGAAVRPRAARRSRPAPRPAGLDRDSRDQLAAVERPSRAQPRFGRSRTGPEERGRSYPPPVSPRADAPATASHAPCHRWLRPGTPLRPAAT